MILSDKLEMTNQRKDCLIHMENFAQPEWIDNYCVGSEKMSDCIERWRYSYQKEYGHIYICRPYPGIHLWANDVYMHSIPTERLKEYHFIKLNYCSEGRSEVLLEDERYVYLEKGILSVDSNAPKEKFLFPGGRYAGLEMILDMHELKQHPIQAFLDCGVNPEKIEKDLRQVQGSYLAVVSREWRELAEVVMEKLKNAEGRVEDFRFYTLQLLYLLCKGNMIPVEKKFYLTKGQRSIVARVEEMISSDLKCRHTVEQLAAAYGISPSSLKKYFQQVYGMSISEYIREKRMRHASALLAETRISVADIAAEAGYGNQGKFSSVFKKYAKMTPLEYRRLHSERSTKE